MKLYHGTNTDFAQIDLSKSRRCKDFGQGFYLSDNYAQALEMARHKTKQEGGTPIVQEYVFDENKLNDDTLRVKRFDSYSEEWVRFIIQNRENRQAESVHNYDIVIGPIANDTVGVQLFQFKKHYINMENLINNLRYKELTIQYFFGTEAAIATLKRL